MTLHGLGATIPKTLSLGLSLQDALPGLIMKVSTSSVQVTDDIETPEGTLDSESRWVSAIRLDISLP